MKERLFYDPAVADGRAFDLPTPALQSTAHALPKPQVNPARVIGATLERLSARDGWAGDSGFAIRFALTQSIMSTPGWEDGDGKKTTPNAKPISMAQWGMAIQTLDIILQALPDLAFPDPGADPGGFVLFNWPIGDSQFLLELHAGMVAQTYKWRRVVDGMPRDFSDPSLHEVITALRQFMTEAKRARA